MRLKELLFFVDGGETWIFYDESIGTFNSDYLILFVVLLIFSGWGDGLCSFLDACGSCEFGLDCEIGGGRTVLSHSFYIEIIINDKM